MNIITMNDIGFLTLMQSLDSLFPIGSFTLSNGMETYVQKEIVTDGKNLTKFLSAYIYTLPCNDLGFAAAAANGTDFTVLDNLCAASKSPKELREGSNKLCTRLIKLEQELGNYPTLMQYAKEISEQKCIGFHCIAMGLLISDVCDDIKKGLEMYCYSLLSSLVNHAVKLVPLRQLDGQRCLTEAISQIPKAVDEAVNMPIDDLGISGMGFDLRSIEHEYLYSRLYIS